MDEKLLHELALHREHKRELKEKERDKERKILNSRKGKTNKPYTDKQKVMALHTYSTTGSWVISAKESGIAYGYLRTMGQSQWFKDSLAEIRREQDEVLDGDMSEIIKEGVSQLKDRVKYGDWMWNSKENRFVRKTLNAGILHKITTGFMDQRNVARGKPTRITEQVSVNDRLKKLAAEFENFQKGRTIHSAINEVVDVELIEELTYGNETELQEGICELSGEPGADQEPGLEEYSPGDGSESRESIEG